MNMSIDEYVLLKCLVHEQLYICMNMTIKGYVHKIMYFRIFTRLCPCTVCG